MTTPPNKRAMETPPAPERIYLQNEDAENHPDTGDWLHGTTWCADKINDGDIEYVRADLLTTANTRIAELMGQNEILRHGYLPNGFMAYLKAELEKQLSEAWDKAAAMIANDGFAASFQTMSQYRTALIRAFQADRSMEDNSTCVRCHSLHIPDGCRDRECPSEEDNESNREEGKG